MSNIAELKQPEKQRPTEAAAEILFSWFLSSDEDFAAKDSVIYKWNGSFWKPLLSDEAERIAIDWLANKQPKMATASKAIASVDTAAKVLKQLPARDKNLIVIPFRSDYIIVGEDGSTRVVKPDKKLGVTYSLSCEYQPDAICARFDAFIKSVLPDPEVRDLVQEYIGYSLIGDARYQVAQLWHGTGSNGKGTLGEIVSGLHGTVAALNMAKLEGFALESLICASLAYTDECPTKNIDEQPLKTLISGNLIEVARKYKSALAFRNTAKIIACANHIPATQDQSDGFWRRWHIIPFVACFPADSNDPMLARNIVMHEMPGVANWALEGLVRLLQRGRFGVLPEAVRRATEQGKRETNSVAAWFAEIEPTCEGEPEGGTPKSIIYSHYSNWSKQNGMAPVNSTKFWMRLASLLKYKDERISRDGKRDSFANIISPKFGGDDKVTNERF